MSKTAKVIPLKARGARPEAGRAKAKVLPKAADEEKPQSLEDKRLHDFSLMLLSIVKQEGRNIPAEEMAGVFAMMARDLAELQVKNLPEGIEKANMLRIIKRTLCECLLSKSQSLGRYR